MEVADAVCIVTGAGSGLGRATALRLAQLGARVAWLDRNVDRVGTGAGEPIRWARAVDVTDGPAMELAFTHVVAELGAPRVLVNCAGVLGSAKVAKVGSDGTVVPREAALFTRVIEINVVGTFNAIRLFAVAAAALPVLPSGERGVIVNTASIAADEGLSGQTAYAASKGAVAAMTLPLARELGSLGIRVVDIKPGVFRTGIYEDIPLTTRQSLDDDSPFPGRPGEPAEFAVLVEQIISNSMLNGSTIRLDGASRMREPKARAGDGPARDASQRDRRS